MPKSMSQVFRVLLPGSLLACLSTAQGNSAVYLNGADAYGLTSAISGATQNSTWEAWIRLPNYDPGVLAVRPIVFRVGTNGYGAPMIDCSNGAVDTMGYCGPLTSTAPPGTLLTGNWHHVAAVYTQSTRIVFVDGIQTSTGPSGSCVHVGSHTVLGAAFYIGFFLLPLKAEVDEVRVSDTIRYAGNFTPQRRFLPDANTAALWHFDEGTGNVANDSSGNNHHFTLFGGYSWVAGVSPAIASPYGSGCGNPVLTLSPDPAAPPVIGSTAGATISNSPSPFVAGALGWSNTTWGGGTLPMSLAPYGAPGCDLLQSLDCGGFWWPTVPTGSGTHHFSVAIPNVTFILGIDLHVQCWAVAPGANAAGILVSNGLTWTFGTF